MAFMEWGDKYLLGINEIDAQHQQLFALLNRLHAMVVNSDHPGAVGDILDELIDYTVEHFSTEEKLFLATQYPQYEEHKRAHDLLTRQVVEIQDKFRSKQTEITFDLLDFLSDWLKQHTTDSDLQYARFIRTPKESTLK